jgi:hypothetical protein
MEQRGYRSSDLSQVLPYNNERAKQKAPQIRGAFFASAGT